MPARKPCCPIFTLVMSRVSNDRVGLAWGHSFEMSTGKSKGAVLIYNFKRAKDRKEEFANTTYAPVKFCPFCGKGVRP